MQPEKSKQCKRGKSQFGPSKLHSWQTYFAAMSLQCLHLTISTLLHDGHKNFVLPAAFVVLCLQDVQVGGSIAITFYAPLAASYTPFPLFLLHALPLPFPAHLAFLFPAS